MKHRRYWLTVNKNTSSEKFNDKTTHLIESSIQITSNRIRILAVVRRSVQNRKYTGEKAFQKQTLTNHHLEITVLNVQCDIRMAEVPFKEMQAIHTYTHTHTHTERERERDLFSFTHKDTSSRISHTGRSSFSSSPWCWIVFQFTDTPNKVGCFLTISLYSEPEGKTIQSL